MSNARTTVLMTGFGPFPSVPENATMRLVPALAERARRAFPDLCIETDVLPTEWRAAPARVETLYALHAPDIALHFGVSSRARGFEIEARGRNVRAAAPDACGEHPESACVDDAGPELRPATLPVTRIVEALRRQGMPAFVSRDAGTYLCNALLYATLGTGARGDTHVRAGFIHIPASLAGARPGAEIRMPGCPLTWPQTLAGGLEILRVSLGRPPVARS